jgi:integrase
MIKQLTGSGDTFLWDEQVPGFGVRCRRGQKTYVLQYRVLGGRGSRQRRVTLGRVGTITLEDARVLAQEYLRGVRYGHDPAGARQAMRAAPRVEDLAERYLREHADVKKKASSARMDHVNMRRHVLPALGTLRVETLTRADVARLHHGMRETPGAANRVLALLSKMCALAEQWGWREPSSNPVKGTQRYPERARERHLAEAELGRLGAVLRQAELERTESPSVIAMVRLLLMTGARRGEVLGLRWERIDWQRGQVRLADSKTGPKTLYLSEAAQAVLAHLPRLEGNPWCLPGRVQGRPLANPQKPWKRLRTQAALEDVRLHDLRHTYAAVAARGGLSLPMIGALLGHQEAQTTQRYAHLVGHPVQAAAEQVGEAVRRALGGEKGAGTSWPQTVHRRPCEVV